MFQFGRKMKFWIRKKKREKKRKYNGPGLLNELSVEVDGIF